MHDLNFCESEDLAEPQEFDQTQNKNQRFTALCAPTFLNVKNFLLLRHRLVLHNF